MPPTKPLNLGAADSVLYSSNGERLAVRSAQLSVWDLKKQARLWRANPVPYLNYAAFSPDGARLAVKSTTGQIAVVNATNGKAICDFRNKKDGEGCNLVFSPCGDYVVDGTWEGRLLVRASATGKVELELEFPNEMIHDLYAVDNGSKWIVMHNPTPAGDDDEPPPPYFSVWKWPFGKKSSDKIQLREQGYFTTALSPDGKYFAFDSSFVPKKPSIDILALGNGKTVASIARARDDRIEKLSWSADGKLLGVVKENSVVVYSAETWQPIAEQEVADATDIAFSPSGDTIAIGARKATVIAWNELISSAGEAPKLLPKAKPAEADVTSFISAPEHQKAFKKVLSPLPAKSKIRQFLIELAADDEDRRVAAYEQIREFDKSKPSEDVRSSNWRLKEEEAVAILRAGTIAEFPPAPPDADWKDGYHTALTLLWRSPHPSLLPLVEAAYEKQPRGLRRAALLALLAILGTREAAEMFAACVRRYGWPPLYVRVWDELGKLLAHGDVLLPDIALAANKDQIGSLCDAITYALADGTLKLEQIAGRLDALAPVTVASTKKLIKQLAKYQTRKGIEWRFGDAYSDARYRLSSLLTLSGYLLDPKLPPLVREAAKFTDPVIAMSAAVAMLRQTGDINKSALRRAAQSHETRATLYAVLAEMKRSDLFPKQFATWEAFAASAMVAWLKYPTELGREPDDIELGHTEWLDKRRKLALYVWKFRNAKEPWLAGVSGPHQLKRSPRPTDGQMTFSRFDEWDSATPQEHAKRCAETVEQICE